MSTTAMHVLLTSEVPKYQLLKQRLLADFPGVDHETLSDTLDGITDLHEMIAAVIRSALVDEALHSGLRFRVNDMRERLSRLELRAEKKRQLALEAMTEVGSLSSNNQTLPPRPEPAPLPSSSSPRNESQKATGCHNRRNLIARRCSQS